MGYWRLPVGEVQRSRGEARCFPRISTNRPFGMPRFTDHLLRDIARVLATGPAAALCAVGAYAATGATVYAEPIVPEQLASRGICSAFDPLTRRWGGVGATYGTEGSTPCPAGFAYVSTILDHGAVRPGAQVSIYGTCCELPAEVLTDQVTWQLERCPDDAVATGLRVLSGPGERSSWSAKRKELRCTAIDRTRFQLGPVSKGFLADMGSNFPQSVFTRLRLREPRQIDPAAIPAALRLGIGRFKFSGWSTEICVGYPWGLFLTGKLGIECDDLVFRELQYRGMPGDPPQGSRVNVFADCEVLADQFSEHPTCLHQDPAHRRAVAVPKSSE